MSTRSQFRVRSMSLSGAAWWAATVTGWTLIAAAVGAVVSAPRLTDAPAFVMTAAMLVVLELLPLMRGRGHDPQGVVMSSAFVCAMLFLWGLWPAVLLVAIASLTSDVRKRKSWWKVLFNPAQYALSVGAGYLVMLAVGITPSLDHPLPDFRLTDLSWIPAVWAAYFLVNLVIVDAVLSFADPFVPALRNDILQTGPISFAVMAISPLVVVVAQQASALVPLLLIPLVLLYRTAAMSVEREHAAGHDALTGLPNRSTLRYELDAALTRHHRDDAAFALLLIDLDDFKQVNDTLGHLVGDQLLIEFAARLRRFCRPDDLVTRLGGDEFAVVVHDADVDTARQVALRLRDAFTDPIDLGQLSMEVEASIGIAACPRDGDDATMLLRHADVAMYRAKEQRTGVETYTRALDHNSPDRLALIGELRQALEAGSLHLVYQPKVTVTDRMPVGVEALVRWNHPVRGAIPPDEFVPLAERSGIMPLLTAHVIDLALAQVARWHEDGLHIPVAVNIAPTDLSGDTLARSVAQALIRHRVPPELLELEITERLLTTQTDEAQRTIAELRDLGVGLSLDDFGTGYSSLLRLRSLQVDQIKIDRSFIAGIDQRPQAVGIVRALVDLAHALGFPAIAEGVETDAEFAVLASLGCDAVQGWLVATAMSGDAVTRWLAERTPLPVEVVPDTVFDLRELRAG